MLTLGCRQWNVSFFTCLLLAGTGSHAPFLQAQAEPLIATSVDAAVKPGDQIALRIWNEPTMTGTFLIAEDGSVTLPRLGVVPVAGRSPRELQVTLREAFNEYLVNPSVEIAVLRRIGVQGEVVRPGLYHVDLTMTVRDVLATAGGITERGNARRVYLVRSDQTTLLGGSTLARIPAAELQSGDLILVGRRSWFELNSLAIASTAAVVVSVAVPLLRELF